MNPNEANLLVNLLTESLERAMDAQLRVAALAAAIGGDNPALHEAYRAEVQRLEKNQSAVRIQEELKALLQGLLHSQ